MRYDRLTHLGENKTTFMKDSTSTKWIACLLIVCGTFVATLVPQRLESSELSERQLRLSNLITEQGIVELQASRYGSAIRLFEQAVVANPQNARAFSYMGHAYRQVGMVKRSYKYFGTALEINPNERSALNWSGQVDVVGQNIPLAEEKLARLERLCGRTCPEYLKLKGAIEEGSN